MSVHAKQRPPRSFGDFSTEYLLSLPTTEEIRSFSDEELQRLNNLSNILDNFRYFEKERRNAMPVTTSSQSSCLKEIRQ